MLDVPRFLCGCPRSAENTVHEQGTTRCIACKRRRAGEQYADDADARHLEYRIRYLPIALERTREKLRDLEREARELGMIDLLEEPRRLTANQILCSPAVVDRAWERETMLARIQGRL